MKAVVRALAVLAGVAHGSLAIGAPPSATESLTEVTAVAQSIEALSDEERATAAESLRVLSVSCPYTRAALQLPLALRQAVGGIEAERFNSSAQSDWRALQQGLAQHVAILDALGVTLPVPASGDALSAPELPALIRREALEASANPIGLSSALVLSITERAERIDAPSQALIAQHSEAVEQATGVVRACPRGPWSVMPGEPWTLYPQLQGWQHALQDLAPHARDAGARAEVAAMLELLADYDAATRATLSPGQP